MFLKFILKLQELNSLLVKNMASRSHFTSWWIWFDFLFYFYFLLYWRPEPSHSATFPLLFHFFIFETQFHQVSKLPRLSLKLWSLCLSLQNGNLPFWTIIRLLVVKMADGKASEGGKWEWFTSFLFFSIPICSCEFLSAPLTTHQTLASFSVESPRRPGLSDYCPLLGGLWLHHPRSCILQKSCDKEMC